MKFTVDRGTLLAALGRTQGIADKKGSISNVLAHVLLESIDSSTIRIKCTDYDVILLSSFPAQVQEKGQMAVNSRSFFESIRLWQDPTVEVETTSSGNVECRCGKTQATLMAFDPSDFPPIEKEDSEPGIEVPSRMLAELSSRMAPFMSDDPSRMNLNGMLLKLRNAEHEEGKSVVLTSVATDGHRMAVLEREILDAELPFDEKEAIIHRKGVLEIKKILEDGPEETARLGFSMGEAVIRHGESALYVRQIDDDYPNYSGVIPKNFVGELRVNRQELIHAVKIASPIVDSHSQGIRIILGKDSLTVAGSRAEVGNVETEVFAEYDGPDMSIGYNYRFLLDSLLNISSEQIILGISGAESPSLVRPDDPAEKSLFVVMPMELN